MIDLIEPRKKLKKLFKYEMANYKSDNGSGSSRTIQLLMRLYDFGNGRTFLKLTISRLLGHGEWLFWPIGNL